MKQGILMLCLAAAIACNAQIQEGMLAWKYETRSSIVTTPCTDSTHIYYGNEDGNFYCNTLSDGKLQWKYSLNKPIRSSAVIAEGAVFFGCEDGNVYALDANKGTLKWTFTTRGERNYDMWDYYRSSPAYYQSRIYIGSGDGNVYAIDASNGRELWHFTTGGMVHADPVLRNDTLYIGSFDGNFYALNSNTGQLIWKFKTIGDRYFPKGEIQKAALVTSDAVYFGSRDYNIYALNRSNGTGLWNMKENGSWIIATPFEQGGNLFFGTSDSHAFYSLNSQYGELQWKTALPLRSYNTSVALDTLIFTGCYNGFLYGLGEKSGHVQWAFQTDGSRKNYHAVYSPDGHFRKDFTLYGNDSTAAAGEKKVMALGAVISTPVLRERTIYFGSTDGNLYAVKID